MTSVAAPTFETERSSIPLWSRVVGDPIFDRSTRRILTALCLITFAIYSTFTVVRHNHYETALFDLGIFDQLIRQYAHFQAPIVPLKAPGYNLLGDHFHPILVVLTPLYWIWDDPRMLLIAQAALLCWSAVPVTRFAARRLNQHRALIVAAAYLWSWPLQRMVEFDVHEIALAVPLIAVIIDAIDRGARRAIVLSCCALLLVREDMGLFVVMVALVVAIRSWHATTGEQRRSALRFAAGLFVLGIFAYECVTNVIIPAFATDPAGFVYLTLDHRLGTSLGSAATYTLLHPWTVLMILVTPWQKALTLIAMGLPSLFFCIASPYALLALPFIAQRMLNSRELLWGTNFHYSGVVAPIMMMAGVDAVTRIGAWLRSRQLSRPQSGLPPHAPLRWLAWVGQRRLVDLWLVWIVGIVVAGMISYHPDYPVSTISSRSFWTEGERVRDINASLPVIPDGVCVESDNMIGPHLTRHTTVTRVGKSHDGASWMALDFSVGSTGWEGATPPAAYVDAVNRGFEPVVQNGAIVVLQRRGPIPGSCDH